MIIPKKNETKKEFIKRGYADSVVIDFIGSPFKRVLCLNIIFEKSRLQEKDLTEAELIKIYRSINSEHKIINKVGTRGLKGESIRGEKGSSPIAGVDYFTNKDKDDIAKQVLNNIKLPESTKTTIIQEIREEVSTEEIQNEVDKALGNIDFGITGGEIVKILEDLKGKNRLDASAIKNLPPAKIIRELGGGGGITEQALIDSSIADRLFTLMMI